MKKSISLKEEELRRSPYFDWDKAKHFYYVAKCGSFSEAAKHLNMSQPPLSRKIAILEDHLNFKLFTRTPKGIALTRKGEELFAIIERTFLELTGFSYNGAVTTDNGQKRKIRISTTHAIAAYILNEHLISYTQLHPDVIFEVISDDQVIDLIINDVDLAIRPFDFKAKGVQQEHILTLEKKLFASVGYIEKYGAPQTVEDLDNYHIISHAQPEKHPYSDINWILRLGMPQGKLRTPIFTSNSLECIVKAAKNELGIFGGYEEMEIIKEASFKRVLANLKGPLIEDFIIYPIHLSKDRVFKKFIDFLLEKFHKKSLDI